MFTTNVKEDRKSKAEKHVEDMEIVFSDRILNSIHNSRIIKQPRLKFTEYFRTSHVNKTIIKVIQSDSVSAIFKEQGDIVMNFASHISPCGGYIDGSMAQEEALASESNLYNVLSNIPDFYNGIRWEDDAMVNPDIVFVRENKNIIADQCSLLSYNTSCNVITCAAVDRNYFHNFYTSEALDLMMVSSIDNALAAASTLGNGKTLITGAFGCGVFENDATFVAEVFKRFLSTKYENVFLKVVFAVPDTENYQKMAKVFM